MKEIPRLSAHSLKELDRCPRAFALRYQANRFWPAPDSGSTRRLELGQAFHQAVHQDFLGLDPIIEDFPELEALWKKFKNSPHFEIDGKKIWSEQNLHLSLEGVGFLARFDRLVREGENWIILDWKTGKIDPIKLANDWQTKLYPFVLAEAGSVLNGGKKIAPSQIKLVYWEGSSGISYDRFPYEERKHEVLRLEFEEKARNVLRPFDEEHPDDPNFPRRKKQCKGCGFDSLCNRSEDAAGKPSEFPQPRFTCSSE